MNKFSDLSTAHLLSLIYQDFTLLESGDWSPERHSIGQSQEVLRVIAARLSLSLRDSAGESIYNEFLPEVSIDDYCEENPSSAECRIYDV